MNGYQLWVILDIIPYQDCSLVAAGNYCDFPEAFSVQCYGMMMKGSVVLLLVVLSSLAAASPHGSYGGRRRPHGQGTSGLHGGRRPVATLAHGGATHGSAGFGGASQGSGGFGGATHGSGGFGGASQGSGGFGSATHGSGGFG
ncbi:holotricin-3-like, partial [Homarus americanus]|uniref:holotricin-3-like n=1 Tax=Homarus americanus TaxID=6706 RepID=UPI001C4717B9